MLVVTMGSHIVVYLRGVIVLRKWVDAGGSYIRELPDRSLYVSGNFPDGWSKAPGSP